MGTVDIPGLEKTGLTVEGCAHDFDRAHTAHRGQLTVGLHPAWATGAALPQAASVWEGFLGQLAGLVRDLGRGLSTSAREFRAADEHAAGRVHNAGAGIPAGHPAHARAHGYYQ